MHHAFNQHNVHIYNTVSQCYLANSMKKKINQFKLVWPKRFTHEIKKLKSTSEIIEIRIYVMVSPWTLKVLYIWLPVIFICSAFFVFFSLHFYNKLDAPYIFDVIKWNSDDVLSFLPVTLILQCYLEFFSLAFCSIRDFGPHFRISSQSKMYCHEIF